MKTFVPHLILDPAVRAAYLTNVPENRALRK
jgi:hypothetical protein